jgi:hypothetical protein
VGSEATYFVEGDVRGDGDVEGGVAQTFQFSWPGSRVLDDCS